LEKTLYISDSSSVHHQELFALHINGICHTVLLTACEQAVSKHICIAVCTVKNSWWWTEELSETCRVLFHK